MNVPTSSPVYKEEVFGPVVIVNTFTDEDQVLAEANGTDFGLFCMLMMMYSLVLLPADNHSQPLSTPVTSSEQYQLPSD